MRDEKVLLSAVTKTLSKMGQKAFRNIEDKVIKKIVLYTEPERLNGQWFSIYVVVDGSGKTIIPKLAIENEMDDVQSVIDDYENKSTMLVELKEKSLEELTDNVIQVFDDLNEEHSFDKAFRDFDHDKKSILELLSEILSKDIEDLTEYIADNMDDENEVLGGKYEGKTFRKIKRHVYFDTGFVLKIIYYKYNKRRDDFELEFNVTLPQSAIRSAKQDDAWYDED